MKFAPEDVRHQQFGTKFRGFSIEEVDSFLNLVADDLDELSKENGRLKEELDKTRQELSVLKGNEMNFRKMIGAAQEFKEDITLKANKEAELILKEAEMKANNLLKGAETKSYTLEKRIEDLKLQKKRFEISLKSLLENHLKLVNGHREGGVAEDE